tara:strand:- start:1697 stop:1987 length:291 start_codon:yes stop_codon:yes gene_type:complete
MVKLKDLLEPLKLELISSISKNCPEFVGSLPIYAICYPNAIDNAIISPSNELNFVAIEELKVVKDDIDIPPTLTSPKEPVTVLEPLILPLAVTLFI